MTEEKLKTLNDLFPCVYKKPFKNKCEFRKHPCSNCGIRFKIKENAIKSYRFFNEERKNVKKGSKIWLVLTGRIEEIIETNNLTSEDLK